MLITIEPIGVISIKNDIMKRPQPGSEILLSTSNSSLKTKLPKHTKLTNNNLK